MTVRLVTFLVLTSLGGAVAAALGGPTAAPEQQQTDVRLVPADELIGAEVATREGESIGSLAYITLDLDQGRFSHLVVDTSAGETATAAAGQSEQNLLIVPWDIAELDPAGDQVTIAATRRQVENAPRLARQELNQLAEPSVATYVVDHWAPASELAAMEGERAPDVPDTASQAATSAGVGPTSTAGRDTTGSGTAGTTGDQREQALEGLQQGASGDTRSGGGDDAAPTVLFGQEVVTSVAPPMFQLGQDLKGSRVLDRNGQPLGEVRRIMIDAASGDGAYAVIEGGPDGPAPVPLQTLEWSAEGTTTFGADPSALQPDAALTDPSEPVSRQQLAQLYQRFDVQPYWERGQRSTDSGTDAIPTTESRQ